MQAISEYAKTRGPSVLHSAETNFEMTLRGVFGYNCLKGTYLLGMYVRVHLPTCISAE
jgi:hypothetical protein